MKTSILGVRLDPTSRSTNIARSLLMLDVAARDEPAPDIIVVPSGCDRSGQADRFFFPAMSETYWASLSSKAREWGVYVAAAQSRFYRNSLEETAVLIDPDGDEILQHRTDTANGISSRSTVVGSIGLGFESELFAEGGKGFPPDMQWPALVITFGDPLNACESDSTRADAGLRLSKRTQSTFCLARSCARENGLGACAVFSQTARLGKEWASPEGFILRVELLSGERPTSE